MEKEKGEGERLGAGGSDDIRWTAEHDRDDGEDRVALAVSQLRIHRRREQREPEPREGAETRDGRQALRIILDEMT